MKNLNNNLNIKILPKVSGGRLFWIYKRYFDLIISVCLLPVLFIIMIFLLFVNLFTDTSSIFYIQKRMGKYCHSFNAIKFKTMTDIEKIERKYDDPVECHRITRLGRILRQTRLDELPQIINVIKGDMSLIGPRPDYFEHAIIYSNIIIEYAGRHVIKPGISGLAQIRLGYAEGLDATRNKTEVDIYYIENVNIYLDMKILLNTFLVMIKRIGN